MAKEATKVKAPSPMEHKYLAPITQAIECVALIAFVESNHQGDVNANGDPSVDPATLHGRFRKTGMNRKIRDYWLEKGLDVLIRRDRHIVRDDGDTLTIDDMVQRVREKHGMGLSSSYIKARFGDKAAKKNGKSDLTAEKAEQLRRYICETYLDVRAFGALANVGSDKLRNIAGAVKINVSRSAAPLMLIEDVTTREMVTTEREKSKRGRTMGRHMVSPFSLFPVTFSVVPRFARENGFNVDDLHELLEAFIYCWPNDQSSLRRGVLRGMWLFRSGSHLIRRPLGADWLGTVVKIGCKLDDPMVARDMEDFEISVDESAVPKSVRMFDLAEVVDLLDDVDEFRKAFA